jgi:hypothetical protein
VLARRRSGSGLRLFAGRPARVTGGEQPASGERDVAHPDASPAAGPRVLAGWARLRSRARWTGLWSESPSYGVFRSRRPATTRSPPAARRRASNSSCSRSHTPRVCYSSRRRQEVTPEPKADLGRQVRPRDPGVQHKQDPMAARTDPAGAPYPDNGPAAPSPATAARPTPTARPRRSTAQRPSASVQLDDGCRRPLPSMNGSLHYERSSKAGRRRRGTQFVHPPPTPLSGAMSAFVAASRFSLNSVTVIPT